MSRVNRRRPAIAPAAPAASGRPGQPAAAAAASKKKGVCFHFKKHGSCKFGGDEGCRNGTHPAEFKASGGLPAPLPKVAVLPAGVVVGDDAVVRECRLCKKDFTESQNEWFVEKKLEAMPWHCEPCRKIRHEQRKAKAAEVAAIVVSQPPVNVNTSAEAVAVVAAAAAAPSGAEPEDNGGFSNDAWDEVI